MKFSISKSSKVVEMLITLVVFVLYYVCNVYMHVEKNCRKTNRFEVL